MTKKSLFLLMLGLLLLLAACGEEKYEGDYSYEVNDFTFTNQNGEKVSKSDLEGKIWIADFIYTNCEVECPQMTYNLQKVQRALNDAGINDVQFVSFSIDPERDNQEALTEYAEVRGIDFDHWMFLTGYDFDTIKEFAIKSFKVPVEKTKDGSFMHSVLFSIVSPEGNAIKSYNGYYLKDEQITEVVDFIKSME